MSEDADQSPAAGRGSTARLIFTRTAWEQYLSHTDRRLVRRINELIADVIRNGHEGIGKPEPLRGELSGFNDAEELVVTRSGPEPVVIISLAEYQSMKETEYLLRNPNNAAALRRSIAELERGQVAERDIA